MLKMLSNLRANDRRVDWSKCTMGFVTHRCRRSTPTARRRRRRSRHFDAWTDAGLTVLNLGGTTDAEGEAAAYEAALAANVASDGAGYPTSTRVIGVGLDGHVGSIYPNIADVESTRAVVPITGVDGMGKVSTKLSLSLRSMLASRTAIVACAGTSAKAPLGKAEAMVRALEADETPMSFPASALREATFLLDELGVALESAGHDFIGGAEYFEGMIASPLDARADENLDNLTPNIKLVGGATLVSALLVGAFGGERGHINRATRASSAGEHRRDRCVADATNYPLLAAIAVAALGFSPPDSKVLALRGGGISNEALYNGLVGLNAMVGAQAGWRQSPRWAVRADRSQRPGELLSARSRPAHDGGHHDAAETDLDNAVATCWLAWGL